MSVPPLDSGEMTLFAPACFNLLTLSFLLALETIHASLYNSLVVRTINRLSTSLPVATITPKDLSILSFLRALSSVAFPLRKIAFSFSSMYDFACLPISFP